MLAIALLAIPLLQAAQQPAPTWITAGTPGGAYTSTTSGSATDAMGAVLTMRSTTASADDFGVIRTTMPPDSFRGRRIRITADIDTRNLPGGASPWIGVGGAAGALIVDNGEDRAIRGTNTGHIESTVYVPQAATNITLGLLVSGSGEATARGLRIEAQPRHMPDPPVSPAVQLFLDSAYATVRQHSLWRDTVTWSIVERDFRAIAAGAQAPVEAYPAIRYLLKSLGDHHSSLVLPSAAQALSTGNRANPPALVRVQEDGVGYVSVPAYAGQEQAAMVEFARSLQDSLSADLPHASCGWIIDLRGNSGGNMWPMLGGLRPFLGEVGIGSFVTADGGGPPWHARDRVDVTPSSALLSLDSAYVAVLTGPGTGSSGEAVTIAFRGRPRTRSFGLPTAGLSTANQLYPLPDSSMIALTVAVNADRTGTRFGERVAPDEVVAPAAAGTSADPQLERAVGWLRSQAKCAP